MSQFSFLELEWAAVFEAASGAEGAARADPRTACFYARRALELALSWAFKHDAVLRLPYQDNLSALIHEPSFKQVAGEAVFSKARVINTLGNRAVHSQRPIPEADAISAVRELFHVAYWFARTYARMGSPAPDLAFDVSALPKMGPVAQESAETLLALQRKLQDQDEKLSAVLADKATLDEELKRLRAEVAAAKKAAEATPDTHNYSEAETRDLFIDVLLREAGWLLDQKRDLEYPVQGMPNEKGEGFVDYVLWGDDGKPLALIEAKRTKKSPQIGQQQAKLYADCLEKEFGRRPVIFYSNGYQHWLWDDLNYPPRQVQGFYTKSELELLIHRRDMRKPLQSASINPKIVERYYQTRAIRRVAEAFEKDHERKALLVMATGSGKTRTVIALCDLLMRCNWVKRVLFLADRVALVNQAVNAFKAHLPEASPVNLVTEKDKDGRVFVSTYPTMMGLIDESNDGQRRFGPGHFDLVIIDEAHRSVFVKYRAILEYFDSYLIGLTATPKDEIDHNTYTIFDLETGVPTDAYSLEEAVNDGFLVPPKAVSVPLKFQRQGIKYDELSEEEKEQWDALDWGDGDEIPDKVDPEALNKWLFNADTVDKVLAHLMTHGLKVEGGDRLGKTIIFAKNQAHAFFIAERFDDNYPHYKGEFARPITFQIEYAQSLIDNFSNQAKAPHIAISVDMLDTGIDVPEIVNLVFFKLVRSKTKFWQMIGRGTRLCGDLFGPGVDKQFFYIFDFCQNLEFFSQNPETTEGHTAASLSERLFESRLALALAIEAKLKSTGGIEEVHEGSGEDEGPKTDLQVRESLLNGLHAEVKAMNLENFVVRPHRAMVERFRERKEWEAVSPKELAELTGALGGLPNALPSEPEEAKRFDLLVLSLQLALMQSEPGFERLRRQVVEIASVLEEMTAIPAVQQQIGLILELQTDDWWQGVTLPMLERVRVRLRGLVALIDKPSRNPIFSDFEDEIGEGADVEFPGLLGGTNLRKFREKARAFLLAHQDHIAIQKLRMNRALTATDLEELERMLAESGVGSTDEIERAKEEAQGLGLFVRSLVGLDRVAAKQALAEFLDDRILSANQIEFSNLIVNRLTEHGVMKASALYESPFTDLSPTGPEGIFTAEQVDHLIATLDTVRASAVAA